MNHTATARVTNALIEYRISRGHYTPVLPFHKKGSRLDVSLDDLAKHHMEQLKLREAKLQELKKDLEYANGVLHHPKKDLLFQRVQELMNTSKKNNNNRDYHMLMKIYCDLVELMK